MRLRASIAAGLVMAGVISAAVSGAGAAVVTAEATGDQIVTGTMTNSTYSITVYAFERSGARAAHPGQPGPQSQMDSGCATVKNGTTTVVSACGPMTVTVDAGLGRGVASGSVTASGTTITFTMTVTGSSTPAHFAGPLTCGPACGGATAGIQRTGKAAGTFRWGSVAPKASSPTDTGTVRLSLTGQVYASA